MYTAFVSAMVVTGNLLGVGMLAPQAIRLVRTNAIAGISGAWAGVGIAMNLWWFCYALAAGVPALLPVCAGSLALYAVIAIMYTKQQGRAAVPGLAFGALGIGMVPLPFFVIGGWPLAGLAVGVGYGLQLAPAVISAVRSTDLMGVSVATWVLAWLESAIWAIYGTTISDWALLTGGAGGLLMSSVILMRLASTGRIGWGYRMAGSSLAG